MKFIDMISHMPGDGLPIYNNNIHISNSYQQSIQSNNQVNKQHLQNNQEATTNHNNNIMIDNDICSIDICIQEYPYHNTSFYTNYNNPNTFIYEDTNISYNGVFTEDLDRGISIINMFIYLDL